MCLSVCLSFLICLMVAALSLSVCVHMKVFLWGISPSLNEGSVDETTVSEVQTASGVVEDLVPPITLKGLDPGLYYYRIVVTTTGDDGQALDATTLYGHIEPFLIQGLDVRVDTDPAVDVDSPAGESTLNGHVVLPQDVTYTYVSEWWSVSTLRERQLCLT